MAKGSNLLDGEVHHNFPLDVAAWKEVAQQRLDAKPKSSNKALIPVAAVGVLTPFDYSVACDDDDIRKKLKAAAKTIKAAYHSIRLNIINIGRELNDVKDCLKHGQWMAWLQAEFAMSPRTAARYMSVAEQFPDLKLDSLSNLTSEALYLLAEQNTPAEVRNKALELVENGKFLDKKTVAEMIHEVTPASTKSRVMSARAVKTFLSHIKEVKRETVADYLKELSPENREDTLEALKQLLAIVQEVSNEGANSN